VKQLLSTYILTIMKTAQCLLITLLHIYQKLSLYANSTLWLYSKTTLLSNTFGVENMFSVGVFYQPG